MPSHWPPDYPAILADRVRNIERCMAATPKQIAELHAYYAEHPVAFIEDWCVTVDPRNAGIDGKMPKMPFILFPRQKELIQAIHSWVKGQQNGLIDKCRDVGATWICSAYAVWLWRYVDDAAIGFGSRKEDLVDKRDDPKCIFHKIRTIIDSLPGFMQPHGYSSQKHDNFLKIVNPENGATITGEAGDNIGRGGRTLVYFKDESSFYERPSMIEAALGENTNSQVDISTHNGTATVFYRKTQTYPKERVFEFNWWENPNHDQEWFDGREHFYKHELGMPALLAQEILRDPSGSVEGQLIPAQWVKAAVNAAERLGYELFGEERVSLDVADEGGDANALCYRFGIQVEDIQKWFEGTTTETADRAIEFCDGVFVWRLVYDSIGVGAGIKGAVKDRNKTRDKAIDAIGWNGAEVVDKWDEILPGKTNGEMFSSGRAQAWWQLRLRFQRTFEAIELDEVHDPSELISLNPGMPLLHDLVTELSQPTFTRNSQGKIVIDKKPDGARSPNLADAVVMGYAPIKEYKVEKKPVKGLY